MAGSLGELLCLRGLLEGLFSELKVFRVFYWLVFFGLPTLTREMEALGIPKAFLEWVQKGDRQGNRSPLLV